MPKGNLKPRSRAKHILFDLDGTIADTAPDLALALNRVLLAHGHAELPLSAVRPYVSRGAGGMIERGFGLAVDDARAKPLQLELIAYYEQRLLDKTTLFDGVADLLDWLDARKIIWGVVTNKITRLTEPLLEQMGLLDRAHCVVSGDTSPERKPSPVPLLHACGIAGILPEDTIYLGDDARDIQAGNAAGMTSLIASWGYIHADERLSDWGADAILASASESIDWL